MRNGEVVTIRHFISVNDRWYTLEFHLRKKFTSVDDVSFGLFTVACGTNLISVHNCPMWALFINILNNSWHKH
jgi:hypothetical protein